jgi:hypothetical protein
VIHNGFLAAGWDQTADSGQLDVTTATAPSGANEKVGYLMYEMTDSLASTAPIIIKIAVGSAASVNNPGIWFMVGTHSDGAGVLIDPADGNRPAYLMDQYTQTAPAMAKGSANTIDRNSFGSGDGGRLVFILFEAKPEIKDVNQFALVTPQTSVNDWQNDDNTMLFSIERGRDWSGAYVGTHVAMVWTATTALPNRHIYFEAQHGHTLLAPLQGIAHGLGMGPGSTVTAATFGQGYSGCPLITGNFFQMEDLSEVAPATPPIHFLRNTLMAPPGINMQLSRWSRFQFFPWPVANWQNPPDPVASPSVFLSGTTIALSPYGTARTYRTVAGLRAPISVSQPTSGHPTIWVYILYE